ncbi:hypothetical protein Trydic_g16911 [Trypoxylus dichotomus]
MALVVSNGQNILPTSPSSPKEVKNNSFIHAISKKFKRRSQENLEADDLRSSGSDSSSSDAITHTSRSRKVKSTHNVPCDQDYIKIPSSQDFTSHTVNITREDVNINNKHYYATSVDNIIKVFENFAISTRSKSCGGIEKDKKSKKGKKPAPKRILRSPVKYVYVKGWSGLPTQRIPVPRTYASYPGGRRAQHIAGLNR